MRNRILYIQQSIEIKPPNIMQDRILNIKAETEITLTNHSDKNIIQFYFPNNKDTLSLL
jgi:hypothetical protein